MDEHALRTILLIQAVEESDTKGERDGLFALALLADLVLAVIDGRGYIDVLGFALLGVLAWNVLVYAPLIANWLRPRALTGAGAVRLYARWMGSRAGSVLRRSRAFNVPLAAALPRFSTDWGAPASRRGSSGAQRTARARGACA
jgi:hypothetical protein